MNNYAHSEVLVSTDWVADNIDNTGEVRIVESDEDVTIYDSGHIPNAVNIDWTKDLQDETRRDYVTAQDFEELCESRGISNDTTVVFYGNNNNWWACYAFWAFKLFGHENALVMNGGRKKWELEGREFTTEEPSFPKGSFQAKEDTSVRAFRDQVLDHMEQNRPLVDVRSPEEYRGEITHPSGSGEGAMRGGHIPGASNVPWSRAVGDDGTFKSREELEQIYLEEQGLDPNEDPIAYCRIGERSSHTWFVLKYLLGFDNARNYDGSWTEWGNLVAAPIEKGAPQS